MFAVFGEEGAIERKSGWETLFDVEDPRTKVPQCKGKFLDVNQALEVARYDIQYCDWRARQDVLAIMLLHEKVPQNLILLHFFSFALLTLFFSKAFHSPSPHSLSAHLPPNIFRLMRLCNW